MRSVRRSGSRAFAERGKYLAFKKVIHALGAPVTRLATSPLGKRSRAVRWVFTRLSDIGKAIADRDEIRWLEKMLEPGMRILDIGANQGFLTECLAKRVGAAGHVVAFEPDPLSFSLLSQRMRHRALHNVSARQIALGDREGEVTLYCGRSNRSDNRLHAGSGFEFIEELQVKAATLDGLLEQGLGQFDAIKMDVQGAEVSVFRGMSRYLFDPSLRWMWVEFSPGLLRDAGEDVSHFWLIPAWAGFIGALPAKSGMVPVEDWPELAGKVERSGGYVDVVFERPDSRSGQIETQR